MIGSGIFIVPATIAGKLGALVPILLVWTIAGLLTLFGALALAELASILPEAGGPYAYLRDSYGRVWGFLFSWNDFFINKAGSLAAISIGFATFLAYFVPAVDPDRPFLRWSFLGGEIGLGFNQLTAIAVIAIVTLVNIRGVRWGGRTMNAFTLAKVVALVGLIAAVVVSGKGRGANLLPLLPDSFGPEAASAFGLAMVSALWAYDGWIDVTLTSGETVNPTRNVPLALGIGTLLVMTLYLAANVAFALVIPIPRMAGSERIAADVAAEVLGPVGAGFVVVGILCSTFGAANGMALAGPRSIWVTGRDRVFAASLGRVHPRFRTPHVAIATIGIWSALLTLSGSYEQLTAYVVFGSWIFYAMAVGSVLILRRKMPDVPRPYRAWGYPWTALAFLAVAGWFVLNTLLEAPRQSMIGMGLLLLGLPLYAFWTRRR
jgi:amino acid transporter